MAEFADDVSVKPKSPASEGHNGVAAGSQNPEHDSMKNLPSNVITDSDSHGPSSSPSPSKGKNAGIITKDEDYFMESAFMVFQVERCLFRVPSYLFSKESQVFGGMFRLPQPYPHHSENGETEGSCEANPIILPDEFTKADFRCLLKALYPLSFTLRLRLSKDDWLSVLKLSTKWFFLNLRKTAISELSLSSLESITYGRTYRISAWLLSGLVDLIIRDKTINDSEAIAIDSDYPTTAYRLFRTRELRFRGSHTQKSVVKEIEFLFKEELAQVRADEKAYEGPEVEVVLEDGEGPKQSAQFANPSSVFGGSFDWGMEEDQPKASATPRRGSAFGRR